MLQTFDRSLSIILKLIIICTLIIVGLWSGVSVWANIVGFDSEIKLPAIAKAEYQFKITTTGETLLATKYDLEVSPNDESKQLITLHGFYQLKDNKWIWSKGNILLDEYFFGKIMVTKRRV